MGYARHRKTDNYRSFLMGVKGERRCNGGVFPIAVLLSVVTDGRLD